MQPARTPPAGHPFFKRGNAAAAAGLEGGAGESRGEERRSSDTPQYGSPGATQKQAYLDAPVAEHALVRRHQLAQQVHVDVLARQKVLGDPKGLQIAGVRRAAHGRVTACLHVEV